MKFLFLILVLSSSIGLRAAPDTLTLSPKLLRSIFSSASDSTDHVAASSSTAIEFIAADGRSVYLAGTDTVVSPQHGDELSIWYSDSATAAMAFSQAFQEFSDRNSSMYAVAKTGLYAGRTGTVLFIVWYSPYLDGYNHRRLRRFFGSAQFAESLEVYRTVVRLR